MSRNTFSQLVPHLVHQDYNSQVLKSNAALPAIISKENCVVVILDLSGYTNATQLLMDQAEQREGVNASQYIGKMVQHFLDPILDLVYAYGGDMIRYGGDALFCIWDSAKHGDVNLTFKRAMQCSLDASKSVRERPMSDFYDVIIPLAVHSVVIFGKVDLVHMGDENLGRMDVICLGHDYFEACHLLQFAGKDEIATNKTTAALLNDNLHWSERDNYLILNTKLFKGPPLATIIESKLSMDAQSLHPSYTFYVDASVRARIQDSKEFNPEIRQVTTCFIHLKPLQEEERTETLAWPLNEFFNVVEQSCRQPGSVIGFIRQISVDDKGISLLLLFGMPPAISENPCVAAACVALKLQSIIKVQRLPFTMSSGISTGRIFSGLLSTQNIQVRQEHAILGTAVNMAARLMCLDEASNGILCDKTSRDLLSRATGLVKTKLVNNEIHIKGLAEAVPVWYIRESSNVHRADSTGTSQLSLTATTQQNAIKHVKIDFHDPSQDEVWKKILISNDSPIHSFVIEGPSGVGKSATAARMRDFATSKNWTVWDIQTFEIEQSTPFSCIRQILPIFFRFFKSDPNIKQTIQGIEFDNDSMASICHVLQISASHVNTVRDLQKFILSKVTASSVQGSTLLTGTGTAQRTMTPDSILKAATETLVAILNGVVELLQSKKLMIIFDDCQWQDKYSWAITVALQSRCPRLEIVLLSRPLKEYRDPSLRLLYEMVRNSQETCRIEVGVVTLQRINTIVRELFGTNVDVEMMALRLYELSSGNAFALDVLLRHVVSKRTNELKWDPLQVLPKDTQDVFVSQLDSLETNFQSFIRMAALIGQSFNVDDVLSLCEMKDVSISSLSDWDKFGFIEPLGTDEFGKRWRFKHCLITFQIYSLLTNEERLVKQTRMAHYFEQLLKTESHRKSELLPLLFGLHDSMNDKDKAFHFACKLVSLYNKLEMRQDCRRMLLYIKEDNRKFLALEERIQNKMNMIGLMTGFQLDDVSFCHLFFGSVYRAYTGMKLNTCMLALVFQALGKFSELEKFWKPYCKLQQLPQSNPNFLDADAKHRLNVYSRTLSTAIQAPSDLRYTLQLAISEQYVHLQFLKFGPAFPQFVEILATQCAFLCLIGKTKLADFIATKLGFYTMNENDLLMKRITEYQSMSLHEIDNLPLSVHWFTRAIGPLLFIFLIHYGRAHRISETLWNVAKKYNALHLMEPIMLLYVATYSRVRNNEMFTDNDAISIYTHTLHSTILKQPSYVPNLSVSVGAVSGFLAAFGEIYNTILNKEKYKEIIPKNLVMDYRDYDFALQFVKKYCPPLNAPAEQLMMQFSTSGALVFYEMKVNGNYDAALDYLGRLCSAMDRFQGTLRLMFSGMQVEGVSDIFLMMAYFSQFPDEGREKMNESQYQKAFNMLIKYFDRCKRELYKKKSQWNGVNLFEISYYEAAAMSQVIRCKTMTDCQKAIPLLSDAIKMGEKYESYYAQQLYHVMSLFMKAGLTPFPQRSSIAEISSESLKDCLLHYEKAMFLFNRMNAMWTPRHLKRIALSIGLS